MYVINCYFQKIVPNVPEFAKKMIDCGSEKQITTSAVFIDIMNKSLFREIYNG